MLNVNTATYKYERLRGGIKVRIQNVLDCALCALTDHQANHLHDIEDYIEQLDGILPEDRTFSIVNKLKEYVCGKISEMHDCNGCALKGHQVEHLGKLEIFANRFK